MGDILRPPCPKTPLLPRSAASSASPPWPRSSWATCSGSGVFFTPGELAAVAQAPWQVYFFWGLCGLITLCGALTLAELTVLLPHAGASYHVIREGFGPFWGFIKIWIEMWVSGPGSVAGVAIVFGEIMSRLLGARSRPHRLRPGARWPSSPSRPSTSWASNGEDAPRWP